MKLKHDKALTVRAQQRTTARTVKMLKAFGFVEAGPFLVFEEEHYTVAVTPPGQYHPQRENSWSVKVHGGSPDSPYNLNGTCSFATTWMKPAQLISTIFTCCRHYGYERGVTATRATIQPKVDELKALVSRL